MQRRGLPWRRRGALISIDRETVDGVEAASIIVEGEMLLARPPWTTAGRWSGGQAQVLQDLSGGGFVLDRGDQRHPLATPRARENVKIPGAPQQRGPGQAALSLGIVGTVGITRRQSRSASQKHSACHRIPPATRRRAATECPAKLRPPARLVARSRCRKLTHSRMRNRRLRPRRTHGTTPRSDTSALDLEQASRVIRSTARRLQWRGRWRRRCWSP